MQSTSDDDDTNQSTSCSKHNNEKIKDNCGKTCENQKSRIRANTTIGLKFDDVIGAFKTFKGDFRTNIFSWITNFEGQSDEFGFSDVQKFILAKRLLKDNAKLFLEFESRATSWKSLKQELIFEFNTKVNSSLVHQKLKERRKNKKESIMSYFYEMLSIAASGGVDEAATITYTIDGLPGSTQMKNFMYEATTIPDFKTKIITYEIMMKNDRVSKEDQPSETQNPRCISCGLKGHLPESCPTKEKGRKCFKCNAYGHMSASCPGTKPASSKTMNILQRIEDEPVPDEEDETDDEKDDEFELSEEDQEKWFKKLYYQSKSRRGL